MSIKVRHMYSDKWCNDEHKASQWELKYAAQKIVENADKVEDIETPGCGKANVNRCLICTSEIFTKTKYYIHLTGFEVNEITEIHELT